MLSQARAKAKARSAQEQYSAGLGDGVTLEMVEALESKARQAASEASTVTHRVRAHRPHQPLLQGL